MNSIETTAAPSDTVLAENTVYQLIGNSRRRAVINILLSENQPIALSELARQTAEVTSEHEGMKPSDIYKSVYVSLQQNHLPKLDKHDVVVYDVDAGSVAPGPQLHRFVPYVRRQRATTVDQLRRLDPTLVVALVALGVVLGLLLAFVVGLV
ncbi:hypothetical protein SAMN04487950_4186 [Halogranum rubrum]|uniref:DUF7344 domain-containing protein n=1 Tax=Halogranum rubrum TaxID=553466 RepID=A0A1I4ILY6_9EURY|nr:hypothetical protein [Halogranum rubrum]SFL55350.1 hypothetical protein SAMN04487950_4186 [Halogranum rubrum]